MRMRVRTRQRAGMQPGQPVTVITDPGRIDPAPRHRVHYCGECFGPRNGIAGRLFCHACLYNLFGFPGDNRYDRWIVTMKARKTRLANKALRRAREQ
jgi:hypothetical protein